MVLAPHELGVETSVCVGGGGARGPPLCWRPIIRLVEHILLVVVK